MTRHSPRRPLPNGRLVNNQGIKRDIIMIGGSAGGLEILIRLFQELSPSLPAAIGVVLHRGPHGGSMLSTVLSRRSALPVQEGANHMPFRPGQIYVAPADHHMTLARGRIQLNRGPKEHATRPSVDSLFNSAAQQYHRRVVALLLSGDGDDGVDGMIAVKAAHGLSFVQDPYESIMPFMPMNALLHDNVDAILPIASMASMLLALATGQAVKRPPLMSEGRIIENGELR